MKILCNNKICNTISLFSGLHLSSRCDWGSLPCFEVQSGWVLRWNYGSLVGKFKCKLWTPIKNIFDATCQLTFIVFRIKVSIARWNHRFSLSSETSPSASDRNSRNIWMWFYKLYCRRLRLKSTEWVFDPKVLVNP